MKLPIVLSFFFMSPLLAQTASSKPAVHRAAASASTKNPLDSPPGIPKVVGVPRPLYALRYVDVLLGKGEPAQPRKWYSVNYTGWLTNGTKFDSSFDHTPAGPITFPYGARRVIAGWDTGFEGMRVGGKRRLFVPYQLAYGDQANAKIPAKSNLIFDVELVSMSDAAPAPPPGTQGAAGTAPGTRRQDGGTSPTMPSRPATTTPTTPTPTIPTTPTTQTTPSTPTTPTTPSKPNGV